MRSGGFLSKLIIILFSLSLAQISSAALTTVSNQSAKADKAAVEISKLSSNVKVGKLFQMAEPFFSVSEYEGLLRKIKSSKAKNHKIDKMMFGDSFFYLKSGDIKLVFKWVDKNNVAFTLNGHTFSYEEASKTELWQPKVLEVVRGAASSRSKVSSLFLLDLLFHANQAEAFLNNPLVLGAIGIAAIGLIGYHFYKKHKDSHSTKIKDIKKQIENAKAAKERGIANGETELTAYDKKIIDLETLLEEYNSTSDNVGFFGYLFGSRVQTPASYDRLMPSEGVE